MKKTRKSPRSFGATSHSSHNLFLYHLIQESFRNKTQCCIHRSALDALLALLERAIDDSGETMRRAQMVLQDPEDWARRISPTYTVDEEHEKYVLYVSERNHDDAVALFKIAKKIPVCGE